MTKEELSQIPNNHVIAVIDGAGAAEDAARDLERSGYTHTVLFSGNEVAETLDAKGETSGPVTKVLRAVQDHFSEQPNYLAQYQEEARNGNVVLAVEAGERERIDEARMILERYGARNLRHFGALAVTDLTPDSNPSTRSAESPEKWSQA